MTAASHGAAVRVRTGSARVARTGRDGLRGFEDGRNAAGEIVDAVGVDDFRGGDLVVEFALQGHDRLGGHEGVQAEPVQAGGAVHPFGGAVGDAGEEVGERGGGGFGVVVGQGAAQPGGFLVRPVLGRQDGAERGVAQGGQQVGEARPVDVGGLHDVQVAGEEVPEDPHGLAG